MKQYNLYNWHGLMFGERGLELMNKAMNEYIKAKLEEYEKLDQQTKVESMGLP